MQKQVYFDYFYGEESEQFSYYRIPRLLVTGQQFKNLSTDAKLLYGLMLDRMGLSILSNGFWQFVPDRMKLPALPLSIPGAILCLPAMSFVGIAEQGCVSPPAGKGGPGKTERTPGEFAIPARPRAAHTANVTVRRVTQYIYWTKRLI